MSAELATRTAAVLACATTLSLITTIAAYAAANVAPLRWDGSFCTRAECTTSVSFMAEPERGKPVRLATTARAS